MRRRVLLQRQTYKRRLRKPYQTSVKLMLRPPNARLEKHETRKGEPAMPTKKEVIASLKEIIDPHSNISIYDMGLISELKVGKDTVSLVFRPTSPFCPLGMQLAMNIKRRLMALNGMKKADVMIVGHIQESNINKTLADT